MYHTVHRISEADRHKTAVDVNAEMYGNPGFSLSVRTVRNRLELNVWTKWEGCAQEAVHFRKEQESSFGVRSRTHVLDARAMA